MSAKFASPSPSLESCGSSQSKSEEATLPPASDTYSSLHVEKTNGPLIAELHRKFEYDLDVGCLRWKIRPVGGRANKGDRIGTDSGHGYRSVRQRFGGRYIKYYEHQAVWAMHYGHWPSEIDHIDGNRANNKIENLREVTRAQNSCNAALRSDNKSGVPGVSWSNKVNKWLARIQVDGKVTHLGFFDNLADAIAARKAAELKHGFHPNHGRIV